MPGMQREHLGVLGSGYRVRGGPSRLEEGPLVAAGGSDRSAELFS